MSKVIWENLTCVGLLTVATPALAGGGPDYESEVARWLRLVQGDEEPTIADFRRFEGSGSEWELELERAECARRGWKPPKTNAECVRFMSDRLQESSAARSLFFARLRELIPKSTEASEPHVIKRLEGEAMLSYTLVGVRIGSREIEFGVPDADEGHFGRLGVNRID